MEEEEAEPLCCEVSMSVYIHPSIYVSIYLSIYLSSPVAAYCTASITWLDLNCPVN